MKLKSHKFYLFPLKNGKKKIGYGENATHALEILGRRLTQEEMAEILPDEPLEIRQTDLQRYVKDLG